MAIRKPICPRCGSINTAKILYGEPSIDYMDNPQPIVLGGCVVGINSPSTCCLSCDYRWGGKSTRFLSDMTLFQAKVGGYFGPSYSLVLDPAKGTITYQYAKDGSIIDVQTKPLTTDVWSKLIKGLISCEFVDWLSEYITQGVMDGTSWGVEVGLPYGKSICKHGSNGYPGRWSQFCRLMSRISGATFK